MRNLTNAGIALVALALVAAGHLSAQSTTSQIAGLVTDPSGASIAAAQVTVTNVQTGLARSVESNALGYFTVAALQPGEYTITCKKEGFRTLTRSGVTLLLGQTARLDLPLEVGDLTQSVVVQEDVRMVQADRPESSTAITTR